MKQKAVVILSGGQDSTTCLFWAITQGFDVSAISFDYGQKHKNELKHAARVCEAVEVPHLVFELPGLNAICSSKLFTGEFSAEDTNDKNLPSSFVPNRNQLFITLAHAYAQQIGAWFLIIGASQVDYSGYPDCRREFLMALEGVTNMGSASAISILYPLMDKTKADIFVMAEEMEVLDVIVNDTLTCYHGIETPNEWGVGCGECNACLLRKKGYEEFQQRKRTGAKE